ncbi:peptidase C15 [Acuticoccus sp. MNP-M23]|uniref:pyroglutamyl-peptidase I family protein n=1 Tax=Acuticoccus sp. MNP-M23 TaxID=3072793 RepID=UPI002815F219|nr:peptidase C15 [Acuticoccus sp. MNP-M23]WMS41486.1 peptidase C15 [Acuticoccus sp. MNP-M23]
MTVLPASRPRLLVTGFGPFPGMPDNPAATLVRSLEAKALSGVTARLIDTEWAACAAFRDKAVRAKTVLMFGVAGGTHRIRYERMAHPVASPRPDAAGRLPDSAPPMSRRSALPVAALVAMAQRAGFPVVLSHAPGGYICNASYAAALSGNANALFVHIPQPVGRSNISAARLEAHALWLIGTLLGR